MYETFFSSGARRPLSLISCLIAVLCGAALLIFSGPASAAVANALEVCAEVLIPSLFPFLVFSLFVVNSGLADALGRFLSPATRLLFKLPGCTAAAIVAGFLGGYPAAAHGIAALLENGRISPAQAERMSRFCICAGPAFVLSAVGGRMLGSARTGLLLYASQFAAALTLGILEARFTRPESGVKNIAAPRSPPRPLSASLIQSVEAAVRSLLMLCAVVCLCAVLSALLSGAGITGVLLSLLDRAGLSAVSEAVPDLLLEVSSGCRAAVRAGGYPVLLCSLALSWGGLCIHLQIFSALRALPLNKGRFYLFRLIQTILSGLLTVLLLRLFPSAASPVFSTFRHPPKISPGQNGIWAFLALVALSIIFLFSLSQNSWIFPEKDAILIGKETTKGREV